VQSAGESPGGVSVRADEGCRGCRPGVGDLCAFHAGPGSVALSLLPMLTVHPCRAQRTATDCLYTNQIHSHLGLLLATSPGHLPYTTPSPPPPEQSLRFHVSVTAVVPPAHSLLALLLSVDAIATSPSLTPANTDAREHCHHHSVYRPSAPRHTRCRSTQNAPLCASSTAQCAPSRRATRRTCSVSGLVSRALLSRGFICPSRRH
jgi:hypothetical protein